MKNISTINAAIMNMQKLTCEYMCHKININADVKPQCFNLCLSNMLHKISSKE